MAEPVMVDQVGVRFGIGAGALFVLTGGTVAAGLPTAYGVGLLLVATASFAVVLDRAHALGLGIAGWAFATGFAVHALGMLTFAPLDLARLAAFVAAGLLASGLGARREHLSLPGIRILGSE